MAENYPDRIITNWFTVRLLNWDLKENKRMMPWKSEKNPYFIWLSEIILQQTRVEQGINYYQCFIYNYPDVQKLASAHEHKLMKLWEGLGYYSRCRNLHKAAKIIVKDFGGVFPDTYNNILKLPGIGPYSAAAISSFAYGLPYAVVDGNVIRVLSRFFASRKQANKAIGKKWFNQLAQKLLPEESSARYNQAIMDFGAVICKPRQPLCEICPLQKKCKAFALNKQQDFPVKVKKEKKKERQFHFLVFVHEGKVLIQQRKAKDIWLGLHQFPVIENPDEVKRPGIQSSRLANLPKMKLGQPIYKAKQELTHQRIYASFYIIPVENLPSGFHGEWISPLKIKNKAFPKVIADFLNKLGRSNSWFDGSFSNK